VAQTFSSLAPLLGFPSTDARGAIFFLGIDHFGGRYDAQYVVDLRGRGMRAWCWLVVWIQVGSQGGVND